MPVIESLLADVRGLVGRIGNNGFYFGKGFGHTVIHFIEGRAGMYIFGIITASRTDPCLLQAVWAPYVCRLWSPFTNDPLSNRLRFELQYIVSPSSAELIFHRGIVSALFGRRQWFVIAIKGLLSVGQVVGVYFFHQFLGIVFGRNRNRDF